MFFRIEFLKRLPQALHLFDQKSVRHRLLPPLILQLQDESLAIFALPTVLKIASSMSESDVDQVCLFYYKINMKSI